MNRSFLRGPLPLILAGCLWGTVGIYTSNMGAAGLSSFEISFLRAVFTALAFAVVIAVRDRARFRIRLRDIWCFFGTGVCSMAFFNVCYFTTITRTSLAVAVILMYTAPVFVVLLSAPLFHERIGPQKSLAVVFAVLGCALICGVAGFDGTLSLVDILIGLGAGLGYALYSIFGRYALQRGYQSETIAFYTFVFSALALLPFSRLRVIGGGIVSGTFPWAWLALLTVASTLSYYLYTFGLSTVENGKAIIYAMSEPITAAVLGVWVLHDPLPTAWQIAGMCLVLLAIVLLSVKHKTDSGHGRTQ